MSVSQTDRGRGDEAGSLVFCPPAAPYLRALLGVNVLMATLLAAGMGLSLVGWVFYGPRAPMMVATGLITAALVEWLCGWITHRYSVGSLVHSLAMGLTAVLMLPVATTWSTGVGAAALAAAGAVGIGKWLMGGMGHYPWHPAVVGILGLYLLWPGAVEVPLHSVARPGSVESTLHQAVSPAGQEATPRKEGAPLVTAVRDLLPSGWDMLIGAVPGPIGGGSSLAIVAAGLLLIWRGYLRWSVPLAVLAGAAIAAAVLPAGEAGWLPIRYVVHGEPVGLMWVGYQVLLGSTLFVAVMLAGETVTRPLAHRGQVVYGIGVGVLTVGLRWWPMASLSGCWAVLAMNTLVPVIDRVERRWRLVRGR